MALTSNKNRVEKEGKLIAMPVKAAVHIYKNALVKIGADGYIAPCASESGAVYAGMAYEEKDNSNGANGDLSVRVERLNAIYCEGTGFVAADLGKAAYASDDDTVTITDSGDLQLVGEIIEVVSATQVLVSQNANQTK